LLVVITQIYHDARSTECRVDSFTLWPIQPPKKSFEGYMGYRTGLDFFKKGKDLRLLVLSRL